MAQTAALRALQLGFLSLVHYQLTVGMNTCPKGALLRKNTNKYVSRKRYFMALMYYICPVFTGPVLLECALFSFVTSCCWLVSECY